MVAALGRRALLGGGLASAGLLAAADRDQAMAAPLPHEPFSFLFITDTHLQPELNATAGCADAFRKARSIGGDFVLQGGDHVFDALGVSRGRADMLGDLYKRTEQDLALPVRNMIGNHDCFGVYAKSGAQPTDPSYGKKYFQDRWGSLFYGFRHRGVQFFVLDSIGLTADRDYEGKIDAAQIAWLNAELAKLPPGQPIVVASHIPLVTAYDSYLPPGLLPGAKHKTSVINASEVLALLYGRNVLGVLQGHTHVNEVVQWRGIPFITGGAVSGNWWHGTHLGTPEGFTVVSVADNRLSTCYETYGFSSVEPRNG